MAKLKKEKLRPMAQLKKDLDKVFSIFIRQRDKGVCFTCGDKKRWKYQHNGHFISRTHLAVRWDEYNCNCQCVGCNVFKSGNYIEYTMRLIEKYGHEKVEELIEAKKQITKLDRVWYLEKIEYYSDKIR